MENTNYQIINYLDFYLETISPKYAILLTGKWGSGKTHFIKKYRQKKQADRKFLYITLYGVSNPSAIEDQVFQQLHPILASKPVVWTTNILKAAARAGFKFDFDGDGKSDGTANLDFSKISVKDFLDDSGSNILVFDDLERCLMPLSNTLGYINHLVEHQGNQAIILAHSEAIKPSEEDKFKFNDIKEKLIGRTFNIEPNIGDAIDSFLEEAAVCDSKDFLQKNKSLLRESFSKAGHENLRSLRQAIMEFGHCYKLISEQFRKNEEFLRHLLESVLMLALEIQGGFLSIDDIAKLDSARTSAIARSIKKEKSSPHNDEKFVNKYSHFDFRTICPSLNLWQSFFKSGSMDADILRESVSASIFFKSDESPDWVNLWHFPKLENDEFEQNLTSLKKNFFENRIYKKPGVIRHITGILIHFQKNDLFNNDMTRTLDDIAKTIDKLHSEGSLELESRESSRRNNAYAGLAFLEKDTPEFLRISKKLDGIEAEQKKENIKSSATSALNLIQSGNTTGFWKLVDPKFQESSLVRVPFLHHIPVSDFYNALKNIPHKEFDNLGYAFNERAKMATHYPELKEELEWFKSLHEKIEKDLSSQKSIKRWLFKKLSLYYIVPMIETYKI